MSFMNDQIIGLHDWLETPAGRYLLAWEQSQMDSAVADIFGFHALQLGLPELDALVTNRMPHQWLANHSPTPDADFLTDFSALPFQANSLDLVVLPHTLELSADPHTTLREVERVLVPEGRAVICGFNPVSLWGLRQQRARLYHRMGFEKAFLPHKEFIGYWRLRDWLRLLGFEVEVGRFGCYRPALSGDKWLQRFAWMDPVGDRWWPVLGAVYFLVAVKRVHGMTLLSPSWRVARVPANVPVSVAGKLINTPARGQK
jgi:SAM-dependent methyltransferase